MTPLFDIKELIALMRAGTSEQAIPHLEYITQKLPTHVAAHALLAQAYTNERRYEEARVAWQNALFLMPNSPSIKKGFRRVLKELAKQKFAQATPSPAPELEEEPGALQEEQPELEQELTVTQEEQPERQEEAVAVDEQEPELEEEPSLEPEEALPEPDDLPALEDVEQPEDEELPAPEDEKPPENEETPVLEGFEHVEPEELPSLEEEKQEDTVQEPVVAHDEQPVLDQGQAEEGDEQPESEELSEILTPGGDQSPPASEASTLAEQQPEDAGQVSPFEEATPSLLINPSSHHNVTPVEIEASLPDKNEGEQEDEEELDDVAFENDFPLPVITVPTPQPASSGPPSDIPEIPIPPILAPLVEDSDEWHEDQELDHLIQELESARIIPKPDHEHIETPALEDNIEDMVSETLARIFEGQKQYAKAADMYDRLAAIHPERSKKFKDKAAELRAMLNDSSNQVHETDTDES